MLITNQKIPNLWEYNPCDCVEIVPPKPPSTPPIIPPDPPNNNQSEYLEKYFNDSNLTVTGDLIIYGNIKDLEIYDNYGDLINPDNINLNNNEYVVVSLQSYRPINNFKYIRRI